MVCSCHLLFVVFCFTANKRHKPYIIDSVDFIFRHNPIYFTKNICTKIMSSSSSSSSSSNNTSNDISVTDSQEVVVGENSLTDWYVALECLLIRSIKYQENDVAMSNSDDRAHMVLPSLLSQYRFCAAGVGLGTAYALRYKKGIIPMVAAGAIGTSVDMVYGLFVECAQYRQTSNETASQSESQ